VYYKNGYLVKPIYVLNPTEERVAYLPKAFCKSKKIEFGNKNFLYITCYIPRENTLYEIKPVIVLKIAKKSLRIVLDTPRDFVELLFKFTDFYIDIKDELEQTFKEITGISLWEEILNRISVYPALPGGDEK